MNKEFYRNVIVENISELFEALIPTIEDTIDIEYEEVKPKQLEENNEKRSN